METVGLKRKNGHKDTQKKNQKGLWKHIRQTRKNGHKDTKKRTKKGPANINY